MKKRFGIILFIVIMCVFILALVYKVFAAFSLGYKYDVSDGYITRVEPSTTISVFKSKLNKSSAKIERDGNDVTKRGSDYICTGDKVTYGGNTYTVIVYGDLDGDGLYSYKDVLILDKYLYPDKYKNENYEDEAIGGNSGGSGGSGKVDTTISSLNNGLWIGDSISVNLNMYNGIDSTYSSYVWGESGKTPNHFLNSFDSKVSSLPNNPSYIYLVLGNNIYSSIERNVEDIKSLVNKLKSKYSGVPIFIQSPIPANSSYTYADYVNYSANMRKEGELLKEYCSGEGGVTYVYVLDGYIGSNGYAKSNMASGDGLHPSSKGSKLLFDNIKKKIGK